MLKMNLKKMILAATMAAFMVYAPAMAEEAAEPDEIIEEAFEGAETVEAETAEKAPAVVIDVVGLDAIAEAEVSEQAAQAVAEAQTEMNAEAQAEEAEGQAARTFTYENDETVIRAEAAVELPEDIEMQVRKVEEGSEEFEAAKQAVASSCGATDDAEYKFYDVTFTVDGEEAELAAGSIYVQIAFKNVQVNSETETQEVFHIDETGVNNVTAQTEEGSNMSSVNFAV